MNPMTLLAMLAVLLLAGAWLTRPLWSRGALARLRRRRANITAYRSRLAELDADVAAGVLGADTAQALRDEAAARLLQDAGADEAPGAEAVAPRRPWLALGLVLLLGGAAAALYWNTDEWRTRATIELAARDPEAAQQQMIEAMTARLQTRLAQQPDDAEGWAMLGRSYTVTQRYADAADAYDRANALTAAQPQPDWLVAAGEARGFADPQQRLAIARPLFERALQLDPEHPKALWYAGVAALQAGDEAAAFAHWARLRRQELPPEIAELLDQQLPQLAASLGQNWQTPASPTAVALKVRVRLAESLRAQLKPGMQLMVFAKAESGPPMPLAVQRVTAPQLPITVTLDDSSAMMPAMRLSQFERWVITARLTSGAGAQALSGDLEGRQAAARADAGQSLDLLIDQQVP